MDEKELSEIERRVEIVIASFIDDFLLRSEPKISPVEVFNKILSLVQIPLTFGVGIDTVGGHASKVHWFAGEDGYAAALNSKWEKHKKDGEIHPFSVFDARDLRDRKYIFYVFQVCPSTGESNLKPISSQKSQCKDRSTHLIRLNIQSFLEAISREPDWGINRSFIDAVSAGLSEFLGITGAQYWLEEQSRQIYKQKSALAKTRQHKSAYTKEPFDILPWYEQSGGIADNLYSPKIRNYALSVRRFNETAKCDQFNLPDFVIYARSNYVTGEYRYDKAFNYRLKVIMGEQQRSDIKNFFIMLKDHLTHGTSLSELGICLYRDIPQIDENKERLETMESYDNLFFKVLKGLVSIDSKGTIESGDGDSDRGIESLLDIFLSEFEKDAASFADACFVTGLIFYRFPFLAGGVGRIKNNFSVDDIGGKFNVSMMRICIAHYVFEAMKPKNQTLKAGETVALVLLPIYVWSRIPVVIAHVVTSSSDPGRLSSHSVWHQIFHVTQNLGRELKRHFRKSLEKEFILLVTENTTQIFRQYISKKCDMETVIQAVDTLSDFFGQLSFELPYPQVKVSIRNGTNRAILLSESDIKVAGTILKLEVSDNKSYPYSRAYKTFNGDRERLKKKLLTCLKKNLVQLNNEVVVEIVKRSSMGLRPHKDSCLVNSILEEYGIHKGIMLTIPTPRLKVQEMCEAARKGVNPVPDYDRKNPATPTPEVYLEYYFSEYLSFFGASTNSINLKELRDILSKRTFTAIKQHYFRRDIKLSDIIPKSI
ncbi:hypothetical protein [Pseudoalteromonas sp. MMG012]|uniref:hypothetical protein n=1 Tax=Pseudoalteromonas sp. MMG012 TaxID=2822686 RepID=UPI001B3A7813|nr:hypothetical protein [Pseudoalteromonas sp. MMG012]MBQ4852928.1 hypothetical protein [Pseudoalteromonas sp. MMG012]